MRTDYISDITHALDKCLKVCEESHLGCFTERESLEIMRIFQQSLRRVTTYGGAKSGSSEKEIEQQQEIQFTKD